MVSLALSLAAPALLLVMVLLASAGWGTVTLRVTLGPHLPPPISRCLALITGLAVFSWLLQWLACFQSFTVPAATGLLLLGCLFFCLLPQDWWTLRTMLKTQRVGSAITLAVLLTSVLLVYLPPALNVNDDTRAYLVFPLKISALGGIGWEPFSERRLFSLGAHYPLQALTLSWVPVRYAGIVEPALGVVLLILIAAMLSTPSRTLLAAGLLWATVISGSKVLANFSPAYLMIPPLLLLLVISRATRVRQVRSSPALAAILGVIASYAVCLRPTAAPFAALMLGWTVVQLAKSKPITHLIAAAAGTATFALPFSLDLLRSGGTLFYPVLGRGFHISAHSNTASIAALKPLSDHLANLLRIPLTDPLFWLAFTLAAYTLKTTSGRNRTVTLVAGGAALFTYGVIIYQTSGTGAARYVAPILLTLALYLFITAGPLPIVAIRLPRAVAPLLVAISVLLVYRFTPAILNYAQAKLAVRYRTLYPAATETDGYRALQSAIPPGTTILASLNRNDLLDLRRNRILINDQPGMTSPPPGWPNQPSGKLFAEYLHSQGVQYIAVSTVPNAPLPNPVNLTRPLLDWEDILIRAYTCFDLALADPVFHEAIVYETPIFRVYRVP